VLMKKIIDENDVDMPSVLSLAEGRGFDAL
jgi:hypothetical protein